MRKSERRNEMSLETNIAFLHGNIAGLKERIVQLERAVAELQKMWSKFSTYDHPIQPPEEDMPSFNLEDYDIKATPCPTCGGSGFDPNRSTCKTHYVQDVPCPDCKGGK
jgi:hypothetical protein